MELAEVRISRYRSVRDLRLPVRRLTVFVGENGTGKTNLHRALELVQAAATGTLAPEIAAEGGMAAALWAGPRRRGEPARIALSVRLSDDAGDLTYSVDLGIAPPAAAAFPFEPQVKAERLVLHAGRTSPVLFERQGPAVWFRDQTGRRRQWPHALLASETALSALRDSDGTAEFDRVRRTLASWRFLRSVRTDGASPLRRPCLAVTAPELASDATNLAAVFATLAHIRQDTAELDRAVADAFPGAALIIPRPEQTATFAMTFPDIPQRMFDAAELSDGTLQFLALAGALLSWRLPPFMALNEPETSLHPDLLPSVARLIAAAAERAQFWIVTHSFDLARALEAQTGAQAHQVVRPDGATRIEEAGSAP